jgi:hypothetical protein
MLIRQMALGMALAASLAAQGSEPGFGWAGIRAGNLSFDPQDHLNAATTFGGQAGMVFDQQRYGLSLEGLVAHPKSDLFPGTKLNHNEASITFLTGLSGDALGMFWPYLGLGLGSITIAQVIPATQTMETLKASTVHTSVGFLHRPVRNFIWGAEGRYLMTFTSKDRKDLQVSALLGFTWGGPQDARRGVAEVPPPDLKVTPPAPAPPVEVAPPPTAPTSEVVASPPPAPPPEVVVAPPPPTPVAVPVVEPGLPEPPPPPPVLAPIAAAIIPGVGTRKTVADSTVAERLDALRKEEVAKSLELGRRRIEAIPAGHWTIRLEIANLSSTLANAAKAFPAGEPDLFIAPIKLRGGKTAYQLFLGDYASRTEAERATKAVPSFFLEGGQRPKPFLGTGIPAQ